MQRLGGQALPVFNETNKSAKEFLILAVELEVKRGSQSLQGMFIRAEMFTLLVIQTWQSHIEKRKQVGFFKELETFREQELMKSCHIAVASPPEQGIIPRMEAGA